MSDESYPGEADEVAAAESSCIPPPDAQAMTRDKRVLTSEEYVKALIGLAGSPLDAECDPDCFILVEHFRGQAETIRRLEQQTERLKGCLEENRKHADQLLARLKSSEARVKQQDDVLAYLLDCGPEIVQAIQEAKSDISEDYGEEQRQERDALREQVRMLQQARKWTTARPTVVGWYWFRSSEGHTPECVHVVDEEIALVAGSMEIRDPSRMFGYGCEWQLVQGPRE